MAPAGASLLAEPPLLQRCWGCWKPAGGRAQAAVVTKLTKYRGDEAAGCLQSCVWEHTGGRQREGLWKPTAQSNAELLISDPYGIWSRRTKIFTQTFCSSQIMLRCYTLSLLCIVGDGFFHVPASYGFHLFADLPLSDCWLKTFLLSCQV